MVYYEICAGYELGSRRIGMMDTRDGQGSCCGYKKSYFEYFCCVVTDDFQVYSNLRFYYMNLLCFYGRWINIVKHCRGLNLQSLQSSIMRNDEVRMLLFIRDIYFASLSCVVAGQTQDHADIFA